MVIIFYVLIATVAFICRTTIAAAAVGDDEYDKFVAEDNMQTKYSKNEIRTPRKVEKVRINDLLWEIEVLWPTERTFINKTYAVYDDNKIIKEGPFDHYDDGKSVSPIKQSEKTVTIQRDEEEDRLKPEAIGGNQELMDRSSSSENGAGNNAYDFLLISIVFLTFFWFY